ncbi:hypothetical protein F5X99DRAFT_182660 [Biscogniauxia marginata]|nr:hypothetical protein F5X99DRAFT_182660 [Biscogniauxia marginata]
MTEVCTQSHLLILLLLSTKTTDVEGHHKSEQFRSADKIISSREYGVRWDRYPIRLMRAPGKISPAAATREGLSATINISHAGTDETASWLVHVASPSEKGKKKQMGSNISRQAGGGT